MLKRATLLHLRIPFSLYLMPVFCFAAAQLPLSAPLHLLGVFLVIHLFLYPASNGYNSYYDRDEGSIGGLENPPPISNQLLWVSLLFDGIAIILGFILSGWPFALMLLVYGLVSKAYSHPFVRLKKYPVTALLTAALFQGGFTYLMVFQALHYLSFRDLTNIQIIFPALLSSLMILGFYPMTQVYQHEEDARRGDHTFSLRVGILGTFYFSGIVFMVSAIGFYLYFSRYHQAIYFLAFLLLLSPLFTYFFYWFLRVWKDKAAADFRSTMRLNAIASVCLIAFFIVFALMQWMKW